MALEKWLYDEIDAERPIAEYLETILQESNSLAFAGLLSAVGLKDPTLFQGTLQPLLGVPEFHFWELQFYSSPQDYVMIGWLLEGYELRKLAQEWHNLPHRKHGLHEVAHYLFLADPAVRDFFGKVRSEWIEQEKDITAGNREKRQLRRLIAEYDIQNYRHEKHEDKVKWIFQPPSEMIEEQKRISKEIEERSLLLNFPMYCRMILNANKPLPEPEIEKFCGLIQRISTLNIPEDITDVIQKEDSICGGVTVLLQLHRDWLIHNPEKREWCLNQVFHILNNPPEIGKLQIECGIEDWKWDSFCAEVIPLLWADEPNSPVLRNYVAGLAVSYRYKTVEILFNFAFKVREQLGDSFKQLEYFIFSWAVAREKYNRSRNIKKIRFNTPAWIKKEIKAFCKATKYPKMQSFSELFLHQLPVESVNITPGLDLWLIKSAYNCLPSLDQALNEIERAAWISFWRGALTLTIELLDIDPEEDRKRKGTPTEWDGWVFNHVATLILKLKPNEVSRDFWEMLLNIASPGHRWIEAFFREFFRKGLGDETNYNAFLREWRAMIEFAFSSPKWNYGPSRQWSYLDEIWISLIGLDQFISDIWTVDKRAILREMADLYGKWAELYLKRTDCALKFISFLKTPAAKELLWEGLVWLEDASTQSKDRFWNDRHIPERLASLLNTCWLNQQSQLRQDQAAFNAFKNLLKGLADNQNPLAMEMLSRIPNKEGM